MNTIDTLTSADLKKADEHAVMEHVVSGKPLALDVRRRVQARAEKITEELRQKYGEMGISADLIRSVRDEE